MQKSLFSSKQAGDSRQMPTVSGLMFFLSTAYNAIYPILSMHAYSTSPAMEVHTALPEPAFSTMTINASG